MPVTWYIIPIVDGPYSRANPRRPEYVGSIRCNWVGHPLEFKNRYVCKVNTTEAKHALLAAGQGVLSLPRVVLTTLVRNLPPAKRAKIKNFLSNIELPDYEDTETLKRLLQRIVLSCILHLPNVSLETQLRDLPPAVQQRGAFILNKWGIPFAGSDTVRDILVRIRDILCDLSNLYVDEF